MDLALNNLQRLICHKNQSTNPPTNQSFCRLSLGLVICLYLQIPENSVFIILQNGCAYTTSSYGQILYFLQNSQ